MSLSSVQLPSPILIALEVLDKRKIELTKLEQPLKVAEDLREEFKPSLSAPRVEPFPDKADRTGQITVVSLPIKTIAEVTPWLTFLAKAGYRQTKKAEDITIMEGIGFRHWRCGDISLVVPVISKPGDVPEDGTCRYVEVGTKQVPIYELKCEDK